VHASAIGDGVALEISTALHEGTLAARRFATANPSRTAADAEQHDVGLFGLQGGVRVSRRVELGRPA